MIFDYRGRKLYLKKNKDFGSAFDYNVSGLEIISNGDNFEEFVVNYVRPNSPAAEAGLKINDRLLALNGFPLVQYDISNVYATLSRRVGRYIHLKVKRGNKIFKIRFQLKREI